MKSVTGVAWRLAVFTTVMVLLLVVVIQMVRRPVEGETVSYTAIFTDANGLKTGDDVRLFGVAVGKVAAITLDENRAKVRLNVQRAHPVYDATTLAIRFQTLTGQRYVDIRQPEKPNGKVAPGATIGTDHTIPSFDITALFNGLEPVLAEFSPGALNQFTENILAVFDGNGAGIGPALDSIAKLSTYVTDRQGLISTLVRNLGDLADQIEGQSPHAITLLAGVTNIFGSLLQKVDGLIDFAATAPAVFGPIDSLAATFGLTPGTNSDLDNALRAAFPDPQAAQDVLGRLPGLLQSLNAVIPDGPNVSLSCSNGAAPLPALVRVLIAGQEVSICRS